MPSEEGLDPVLESAAEIRLLRTEPGDPRLQRRGGDDEQWIPAVVVVGDQLERWRGPVLEADGPDVEEGPDHDTDETPHQPIAPGDGHAQLARPGPPIPLVHRSSGGCR